MVVGVSVSQSVSQSNPELQADALSNLNKDINLK